MAKKHGMFAKAPIRKAMKKAGADKVSKKAIEEVEKRFESDIECFTKSARIIAKNSKRKTISGEDMKLALNVTACKK